VWFVLALLLLCATEMAQPSTRTALEQRIARDLHDFKGVMGIAAINLVTGEEILVNAAARFPAASTIKVAVMLEAYHAASEGRLPLDAILTLRDADKVGGSGVLKGLHEGLQLTARDLIHLMIVLSDNTATNMLVDRLGTATIDERLASYGLQDTRLFRPTFRDGRADVLPDLEREFGLGMTTPVEMARLMALIANGKAVSAASAASMLSTLRDQQDRSMIPRLLPEDSGVEVGNKSGTDQEKQAGPDGIRRHVRGDAAVVTAPGLRYAIAIYARQVQDTRWGVENDAVVMGARISRAIFEYFWRTRF
jgi:beta-lactamase class A